MAQTEYPKTLSGFGYGFNSGIKIDSNNVKLNNRFYSSFTEGKIKKLDESGKPGEEGFEFNVYDDHYKNQARYEAIGEVITDEVYKLLEERGMHKLYVPTNIPEKDATFIYATKPELKNPKKLMILIHGSGVVRAGQWSRSLIINHSTEIGTQIPYIEKARELGYEVIVTNTNDNYRNGKAIPGNSNPSSHAESVWETYIRPANPDHIAIVAHSYGGVVTIDLARSYTKEFCEKVFAIGLTDSVHSTSGLTSDLGALLRNISRNWVTSTSELNTELKSSASDIPKYSAGHTKHEWTSHSCIEALFKFFEEKYAELDVGNDGGNTAKQSKLEL